MKRTTVHAYALPLSEKDIETILFVGHRYAWSEALSKFEVGDNLMTEGEAWSLYEAFESDTMGGHSMFPMLDHASELYERLLSFWDRIV